MVCPEKILAMKLGLALRRRLARFEGLPDEVAGVARTALQAGYGVAEAGTVPGRQLPASRAAPSARRTAPSPARTDA